MIQSDSPNPLVIALVVVSGVILLFTLCRPIDPNVELARTAREAVELARDADASVTAAVLWNGRFRLLAIVLGVSIPMMVGYLIWRSATVTEPDPIDILEQMELLEVSNLDTLSAPDVSPDLLPEPTAISSDTSDSD